MNTKFVALGLASAMAIAVAAPSFAAPVMTSTATVKEAAGPKTDEIRWRGRTGAFVGGAAAGFIAGAAIGSAAAYPYGYGYGYSAYAYDPYYPSYAYAPAPVYSDTYAYSYGSAYPAYPAYPRYRGSYSTQNLPYCITAASC